MNDDDPVAELDAEGRGLLAELLHARAQAARWQEQTEELEYRLKKVLDDVSLATVNGQPAVIYRAVTSRVLDQRRLRSELPDLCRAYSTERFSRPFRVVPDIAGEL